MVSLDHPRRRCGGSRAATVWVFLTALVLVIAAPMLAACTSHDYHDSDAQPAVESGTILLPKPGILNCGLMIGEYCSDNKWLILDTSTGEIFSACSAGQVVSELTGKNENCGRRSKPLQISDAYYAWLATQGIKVPGVPDRVLHTPIPTGLPSSFGTQEPMTPGVSDPVLIHTPTD